MFYFKTMVQEILVLFDYDGIIAKRDYTSKCYEKFNTSRLLRKITNLAVKAYTEGKLPPFLEPIAYLLLLYGLRGVRADEIENYVKRTTQFYLIPGVEDAIKKLKEREIKVGIVSENIQFQPRVAAGLLGVDVVCSNEIESKEGKLTGKISRFSRKKKMIEEIAEKFSLGYEKIIYVGDDADPYCLVKCVVFNPKRKSYLKRVDNKNCFLIKNYSQLLPLIEKLYES
ncbi:MAG: HAD-IB family phosphatase [Candidatus Aenigmatarchaeota archaeon]